MCTHYILQPINRLPTCIMSRLFLFGMAFDWPGLSSKSKCCKYFLKRLILKNHQVGIWVQIRNFFLPMSRWPRRLHEKILFSQKFLFKGQSSLQSWARTIKWLLGYLEVKWNKLLRNLKINKQNYFGVLLSSIHTYPWWPCSCKSKPMFNPCHQRFW